MNRIYASYMRKKQKIHLLNLSKPLYIHYTAEFYFPENISIGKYCRIGHECHLDGEGKIEIGDGTILAPRVVILTSSHNYKNSEMLPYGNTDEKSAVKIGRGCWIGFGAMIRPGVTIGDGAVVAMGAVVTKDVEKGKIVGGNPAAVIAERDAATDIESLIKNEKYFLKEVIEKNLVREGRNFSKDNNLVQ